MNNLVKLSSSPSFTYDWNLIEDPSDRSVAHSAVSEYAKYHQIGREKAEQIIREDNLAKAQCVYKLKLSLQHGQFYDVCEQALGLNYQTASALASSGKLLTETSHKDEVLRLFQVMEPRAGKQFLLMDEQTKHDHVVRFENSGRVPSRNDFTNRTKDDVIKATPKEIKHDHVVRFEPKVQKPSNFDAVENMLRKNRVSVPDLLKYITFAFSNQEPTDKTKALVSQLYRVAYSEEAEAKD